MDDEKAKEDHQQKRPLVSAICSISGRPWSADRKNQDEHKKSMGEEAEDEERG